MLKKALQPFWFAFARKSQRSVPRGVEPPNATTLTLGEMHLRLPYFVGTGVIAAVLLLGACGDNDDPSRSELEQRYQDAVDEMDRRLEDLRDAFAMATGAARAELEKRIEDLEGLRAETAERWDELARMSDDEFDARREDFTEGLRDLRDRFTGLFD